MPSIQLTQEKINGFLNRAASTSRKSFYARISRNDVLGLKTTPFLVYAFLKTRATFADQSLNVRRQKRYLRSEYHKRTISRNLAGLRKAGKIERIGRDEYGMVRDRRGKPINMDFLRLIDTKENALIARFILLCAFWHKSLEQLHTRRIQAALGIDSNQAHVMSQWLAGRRHSLAKRTLRAIVFFCEKPNFWNCRDGYRHKPSKSYLSTKAWCYDFATVGPPPLTKEVFKRFNRYSGRPPGVCGITRLPAGDKNRTQVVADQVRCVANRKNGPKRAIIADFETIGKLVARIVSPDVEQSSFQKSPLMVSGGKSPDVAKRAPSEVARPLPWLDRKNKRDQKLLEFFMGADPNNLN